MSAPVANSLLKRIGRTVDELKDEVRDTLLVLWHDWHACGNQPARGAERLFQQDIKRAIDFIEKVTRSVVDHRDSRWYIHDGQPQRWDELHEALPLEHWLAQESFPRLAALYLRHMGGLRFRYPVPTTTEAIDFAMRERWGKSYGFRRFMILFKRLHDLLNGERDSLLTFREHNVVDYLILGCLVVERMVTGWWCAENPAVHKLPKFNQMLGDLGDELTRRIRCAPIRKMLESYEKKALLHDLKAGAPLPLLTRKPRSARKFVFTTLHNLRVLRNYSAHHYILDFELTYGRDGARAMRTIVSAVVLMLSLPA